jgi:Na+-driven multidrug efflux pump
LKRDTEAMYANMSPWRLFWIVALPGMISMFAMSIYNVIEGAFIGRLLGDGAFAAVNIAMPLVMINFSLADLVGVGASVAVASVGAGAVVGASFGASVAAVVGVGVSVGTGSAELPQAARNRLTATAESNTFSFFFMRTSLKNKINMYPK